MATPRRIHCSYHKCLTQYAKKVLEHLVGDGRYRHFNSELDRFHEASEKLTFASVNNHALDLDRMPEDITVSRFIRDPRDLIVSGYHYHRRGAEPWCRDAEPDPADWARRNRVLPDALRPGESFAECLQRLDTEEGLIAEAQYRGLHFASMLAWPTDDPRVRVWRYEDVVGDEVAAFDEVLRHHGFSFLQRRRGRRLADRFRAGGDKPMKGHIRNPSAGQWRELFTPGVEAWVEQHYGDVLDATGYR